MLKVLVASVNVLVALLFREHFKRETQINKNNAVRAKLADRNVDLREDSQRAARLASKLKELVA